MIDILDKKDCCGCAACVQKCPKHCISMVEDSEGFLYPSVNTEQCIECGICEKVCPMRNISEKRLPLKSYAAYTSDDRIRYRSSSGGIFYEIAKNIIADGGVVFGAKFDEKWQVIMAYTECEDGIFDFMGSKYVQANVCATFHEAESFLKANRKVLYTGTPCQIAGLKKYLRKDYTNLITVDVSCHGVPSPKVWRMYLDEICSDVRNILDVQFRNKLRGWNKFGFQLSYEKDSNRYCIRSVHWDNEFMLALLYDLILRPSCYECKAKHGRSNSDLTIADFWGIENVLADMNDDKGISLVLANTLRGEELLQKLPISKHEVSYESAISYNNGLNGFCNMHPKRTVFFQKLDETKDVKGLIEKTLSSNIFQYLKGIIKKYLKQLGSGGASEYKTFLPIIDEINFRGKNTGWRKYEIVFYFKADSL